MHQVFLPKFSHKLRAVGLLLLLPAILLGQGTPHPALRLKPGDALVVTTPYGGDLVVQSDGAVYGKGFHAVVEGKTVEEAQAALRAAMRPFVHERDVYVALKEASPDVVYVVGAGAGKGPVDYVPQMTLRQVLASSVIGDDPDLILAQVYRSGNKIESANVASLLAGDASSPDMVLMPKDVVALSPAPFVRVWVLGEIAKPGEIRLPAGTDVRQAIAAAGGFRPSDAGANPPSESEARIIVRRGPKTFESSLDGDATAAQLLLESGDTVSVEAPEAVRVTVLGEVKRPGELMLRGSNTLLSAVGAAGGPSDTGSLDSVMVIRNGELYQFDANPMSAKPSGAFAMRSGDLVYVRPNERVFYVLGDVARPGKYYFKDGDNPQRVTDALAMAGGLSGRGTLRRVFLARPASDGHTSVQCFNLDEYLKDGTEASNPALKPGDCLLFGQPKGITISGVAQILSSALIFQTVVRN